MCRISELLLGFTLILLLIPHPVTAQGDNLLLNPGFDSGLTPIAGGAVPTHWAMWGDATSDKESLSALVRSAPYSWRLRKEYGVFTGGGYQTVNVQPGATYRFSIFAMIWTCNDTEFACRNESGTFSDISSGGRVRIGVDPIGGTNPFAGSVQWGGFRSPFTWGAFEYLSIDTVATGATMTVFTYYTADQTMRWHDVFWDDASLVMIAPPPGGGSSDGGSGTTSTQPPQITAVPVVADSQNRPDGSAVHIVQPGQSLWTISRAYDVPLNTLRQWNGLTDSSVIHPGDEIIVRQATSIVPAAAATVTPITAVATATITPFATVIAQVSTPTIAVVRVAPNTADKAEDETLRTGAILLALVVIIGGIITIGGVVVIMGMIIFRPRT